eukprot:SAG11_NODE_3905_length_2156_cov_1.716578_2_plen_151_part_00
MPYIVLQVHYSHIPSTTEPGLEVLDASGLNLALKPVEQNMGKRSTLRPAGVLLATAVAKLVVPPHRPNVAVSVTCSWPAHAPPVDIFAYRCAQFVVGLPHTQGGRECESCPAPRNELRRMLCVAAAFMPTRLVAASSFRSVGAGPPPCPI